MFLWKADLQKDDLSTVKVFFCDIIGCSNGVYNFILTTGVIFAVK